MTSENLSHPASVGRALNFAAGTSANVASALLAPHGLTLAQWAVLVSIWLNGPLSVKQLAELIGTASPAASRLVDRMVEGGLVERKRDPQDRRAVQVDVSAKAADLRPLLEIYQEVNKVLLAELDQAEIAQLFNLLSRVQSAGRVWLETRKGAESNGEG